MRLVFQQGSVLLLLGDIVINEMSNEDFVRQFGFLPAENPLTTLDRLYPIDPRD